MVTTTGVARIALVAKGRFLEIASESVLRFGDWGRAIKVLPIDLATHGWRVRDRHIEEPHAYAGGAAFHRLRPRGRKAAGNAPTPAGSKSVNYTK
jgi:hypothetical protein